MKDLHIDEDLDLVIDDRNDLGTVDEQAEFVQSLAVQVTAYFYERVGTRQGTETLKRIKLQAERLAREYDRVDTIQSIDVSYSEELENTIEVSVTFLTGEDFLLTLN